MAKPVEDPTFYTLAFKRLNSEVLMNLIHNKLAHMDNFICLLEDRRCIIYFLMNIKNNNMDMKKILKGQLSVSDVTNEHILANHYTNGKLVFAKYLDDTVIVTDEYRLQYILKLIEKYVEEGWYCNSRVLCLNEERTVDINRRVEITSNYARCLPQRPPHDTTPELPEDDQLSDNDDLYRTLNQNALVYPAGQTSYHLPAGRQCTTHYGIEKFPVQASDSGTSMDCGRSIIVPSARISTGFHYSANIATNVESFRHGLSESTESNTHELPSLHRSSPSTAATSSLTCEPQNFVRNGHSKPPRNPDYKSYNARLESFIEYNWDETTKPSSSALAESGLYATGRQDLVRCFQCGLGLKDWIRDDDPLTEHVKYSALCEYLLDKLGSDGFRRYKDALSTNEPNGFQNENSTARHDRHQYNVRHPKYQTVAQRQQSFTNFPRYVTQSPRELALAGLFFTGEGDVCRCFTCDGGMKSWAPGDDPFEEHAKYFPQCQYIRQLKGEPYIEMVQRRLHERGEMVANAESCPQVLQRPEPSAGLSISTPSHMLEQLEISSKRSHSMISQSSGTHDCLQTVAATSVLEMGYSKEVVTKAIKQLRSKGKADPDAQDIMELLLEYEDNSNLHSRNGQHEQIGDKDRNKNEGDKLMEENEMLKNLMVCILCKKEERNILCLPCAHHRMCTNCAPSVTHCPSCGKFIKEKIRTYMA